MFDSYSIDPVFNVKAMVHQTGVAAATLRAWERRYGVPSPPRTGSGYRLYAARDVAIIRWLKAQVETGMSISQAVNLLQSQIHQPEAVRTLPSAEFGLPASHQRLHDDVIQAALHFDEMGVERAFSEAFSLFPAEDVCLNVLQPVLVTVGAKWHSGEFTIGHEHFISNLVRRRLLAMLAAAAPPHHEKKIVTACAPDEYHELGLLMISVFLRREGYPVIYLGQNTSPLRMEEVLQRTQPDMVLMSATQLRPAAMMLSMLESLQAEAARGRRTLFVYGGRIFNHIPALRDRMPAEWIGNSAQDSVRRMTQLLERPEAHPSVRVVPVRPVAREVLDELRLRRPDIVSASAKLITGNAFELNTIAHKHERAIETSERLCQVLDAGVCFDDPGVLTEATYWEWDSFTLEGMGPEQLLVCANQFAAATRASISPSGRAILEPFLTEMISALRFETRA
jgi:MerR family transcriptional regulator, light-induced transcriptional regulator